MYILFLELVILSIIADKRLFGSHLNNTFFTLYFNIVAYNNIHREIYELKSFSFGELLKHSNALLFKQQPQRGINRQHDPLFSLLLADGLVVSTSPNRT